MPEPVAYVNPYPSAAALERRLIPDIGRGIPCSRAVAGPSATVSDDPLLSSLSFAPMLEPFD